MTPHLVPIVGWIGSYRREWLRHDLLAGVMVTALIGTCRQISMGPSPGLAAVAAAAQLADSSVREQPD